MSALAGIFKFDPRDRFEKSELMDLARGIDRIGPDGGSEHIEENLGMAYRAYHTTPESHFETQPLIRKDCILTWDGRLDNREEICRRVSRKYDDRTTDIDLVFAAYEEWHASCFAELIGDWALALWDRAKQQLTLARDSMGVRRLFYRLDEDGVAWCTTIEPLVLTSPRKLHLDLDYLAGCLYPRPPVETTAYREIRSVVPASCLTFGFGGRQSTKQYWCLNPHARILHSTDSEYEEQFRDLFRDAVRRRLRADRTILAELSGGLDSSSIVCMADQILGSDPSVGLETLSYYSADEPGGDERPHFTLIEQKRGRTGHHISTSSITEQNAGALLSPLPDEYFSASPGYFKQSLCWSFAFRQIQSAVGARVILSGLGGDELLGGVPYEAPELADYISQGKFLSFAQSAYRWSLVHQKPILNVLKEALRLLTASHAADSLASSSDSRLPWSPLTAPRRHAALPSFSCWGQLAPSMVFMERIRYSLASQLTCTAPPLAGCAELRYPYLDRCLYAFLSSIPRTQILEAGRRRHLMRRALRGITPDGVLDRTTKWFSQQPNLRALQQFEHSEMNAAGTNWISDGLIVDRELFRSQLALVQQGVATCALPMLSAIAIEFWLGSQIRSNTIELPSSDTGQPDGNELRDLPKALAPCRGTQISRKGGIIQ